MIFWKDVSITMDHMDPNCPSLGHKQEALSKGPRDLISCISHLLGAILAVPATFLLVFKTTSEAVVSPLRVFSTLLFGVSMVALYSASALYHYVRQDAPYLLTLRKLDHAMIYVLIAGTYTPILLNLFGRPQGVILFGLIWAIALAGVLFKVFWFRAPRWLSTAFYLAMGWFILVDVKSLGAMQAGGIVWLALGGVFYTIGGVIYAIKKPNLSKKFGFHELFHVFVLLGSLCHFVCVYGYIA